MLENPVVQAQVQNNNQSAEAGLVGDAR